MTQSQLDSAVAEATGESLHTVHSLGFSLFAGDPGDLEPEESRLVVDCPSCRKPVPYHGLAADGSLPMGECIARDVYFPFVALEVYAAAKFDDGPSRNAT
jgi:hypothetical protein